LRESIGAEGRPWPIGYCLLAIAYWLFQTGGGARASARAEDYRRLAIGYFKQAARDSQ
jgi:hypothetical protein